MGCLYLPDGRLVERVVQLSGTGKVDSLWKLREISLISIPPYLLHLICLLEGEMLVPEEVEFSLNHSLFLDYLFDLAGTGLSYHFDLCLKSQ